MTFTLIPGQLTLADIKQFLNDQTLSITLDPNAHAAINAAEQTVHQVISEDKIVYGINTGFGALAHKMIPSSELAQLQTNLVLSHAAGTGALMHDDTVRLIMLLKINSLARGYSGVPLTTIEALIRLFNAQIYPCIPAQGSVGASGDLAPLAHLAALLLGVGEARHQGKIITAKDALASIELAPRELGPKEGLALLNGTQASTALALVGWFGAENNLLTALTTGALTTDATRSSIRPFDARIHMVRGYQTQIDVAAWLRDLLSDSDILASHADCSKVQDPYSIRCQPQVMGACLTQLYYARDVLLTEANAVSDNPLIFANENEILSGGNFHAEPVAMAADAIAISIAEIGALAERRIALLIDSHHSQLPAFLVNNAGINSGFMIAHVTAAALASENKSLAHPASVDSIPTSANQEDHVSMATFAARRLQQMNDNTTGILAVELLAATQGLDFLQPKQTSSRLQPIYHLVREKVATYDKDRFFAPDIEQSKQLIKARTITTASALSI